MTTQFERFAIALIISLIFAGVVMVVAQARPADTPALPQGTPACVNCHKAQDAAWSQGPHAQAMTDSTFQDAWTQQGQPAACLACHTTGYDPISGDYKTAGVACESCHNPVPAKHPAENMPVDKTTDLCSRCHSDAQFGVPNWQISTHYQRNITCSVCHDPHTTNLRSVAGNATIEDPSALCVNCHKDYGAEFPHSSHGAAGVSCVTCHLDMDPGEPGFATAHTVPDHNFMPELSTCTSCHSRQMHAPGESAAVEVQEHEAGISEEINNLPPMAESPAPASPLGFAGVAGLLGLAGGMVMAPWLERAYDRMNNKRGG